MCYTQDMEKTNLPHYNGSMDILVISDRQGVPFATKRIHPERETPKYPEGATVERIPAK